MHFGRVEGTQVSSVDFNLPPVAPRTEAYLKLKHGGRGYLYAGAPIWACKEWQETVYPLRAKPSEYLRYYAQHFAMIELNSSFYRTPSPAQVRRWCHDTGPEFRFLPKVPKVLSHDLARFQKPDLLEFLLALESFDSKLGLPFMQLPEWFGIDQFVHLEKFVDQWPKGMPLAIEFRHPSWFRQHALLDPVVNFLYRRGLATVITDTPGQRNVIHTSLTHPAVLLRFMGLFPSKTDQQRLKVWLDRLEDWAHAGMDTIYLAIHQERNGSIPTTLDFVERYLAEKKFEGAIKPQIDSVKEESWNRRDLGEELVLGV